MFRNHVTVGDRDQEREVIMPWRCVATALVDENG